MTKSKRRKAPSSAQRHKTMRLTKLLTKTSRHLPILAFACWLVFPAHAAAADMATTWETELDREVDALVQEIHERVNVLNRIQEKMSALDERIERLENQVPMDRQRIRDLRQSRLRLAELHGAMRNNAEQALSIITEYASNLSDMVDDTSDR